MPPLLCRAQYGRGGVIPRDYGDAMKLFTRGCELSDEKSCELLHSMREKGIGAEADASLFAQYKERIRAVLNVGGIGGKA